MSCHVMSDLQGGIEGVGGFKEGRRGHSDPVVPAVKVFHVGDPDPVAPVIASFELPPALPVGNAVDLGVFVHQVVELLPRRECVKI